MIYLPKSKKNSSFLTYRKRSIQRELTDINFIQEVPGYVWYKGREGRLKEL